MRSINAVNVKRRICFRKALGLRICKHLCKIQPVALHRGQDEITGAVEDTIDPINAVGCGTIAQALNNRNTASNSGLELKRGLLALGQGCKLCTMMRNHCLVGGDQCASVRQCLACQGQRRTIRPTNKLNHHINVSGGRKFTHIVDPAVGR